MFNGVLLVAIITTCSENVHDRRAKEKFCNIRDVVVTQTDAHSRRTRRDNTLLQDYVVEDTTGNNKMNKSEMRRLFHSTMDQVINVIDVHFSHQNIKLYAAISALQPKNSNFLDAKKVQPRLDLVDRTCVEAETDVAKTYVAKLNGDEKTKPTTAKLLSEHCEAQKTMPTEHLALKLGFTL